MKFSAVNLHFGDVSNHVNFNKDEWQFKEFKLIIINKIEGNDGVK